MGFKADSVVRIEARARTRGKMIVGMIDPATAGTEIGAELIPGILFAVGSEVDSPLVASDRHIAERRHR